MPNPTIPNFPPQGIQAQLDLLYLYNPDVANQLVAQLEAGLIELNDLKEQIEKALQDMQGVLRYKGSVETADELPKDGNIIGDVWNIISTDENVAWDGTQWDKFGSAIDTSAFATDEWVKDNFINADASTYTLATLQDAFTYSNARLYKIFNEDKLPTKNVYTLFSLGWTYNDSNNAPALLAVDVETGKLYFYQGTYENCNAEAWQPFTFTQDLKAITDLIPVNATAANQLVTEEDLMLHTELPAQEGNAGKFLTTNGATPAWAAVSSDVVTGSAVVNPPSYNTQVKLFTAPLVADTSFDARIDVYTSSQTRFATATVMFFVDVNANLKAVGFYSANDQVAPMKLNYYIVDNVITVCWNAETGYGATSNNNYVVNVNNAQAAVDIKIDEPTSVTHPTTISLTPIPRIAQLQALPSGYMENISSLPYTTNRGYSFSMVNASLLPTEDRYSVFFTGQSQINNTYKPAFLAFNTVTNDVYYYCGALNTMTPEAWTKLNGGGSGLPEQTGHTGFLQTDGTDASWSDKQPLVNQSDYGIAIGTAESPVSGQPTGVAIGAGVSSPGGNSVVVGKSATASAGGGGAVCIGTQSYVSGPYTVAIGYKAQARAQGAIQLGYSDKIASTAVNNEANTMKVCLNNVNYKLLADDGTIPSGRLAADGTAGQVLSKTEDGLAWIDVAGGGSGSDNNGLEGDYATTYGIVDETTSGLPYIKAVGSTVVVIPAGLVLDVPGQSGLTTVASAIEYEVQSTENPTLFLAQGEIIEATDVFFQVEEPENGTTGYAAWWNGTTWQFKSNDSGNVWRPANAVRIAKTVFTDSSLTRLCFTGCRVLNKQEFLGKYGAQTITVDGSDMSMQTVLRFAATGRTATAAIQMRPTTGDLRLNELYINTGGGISPTNESATVGKSTSKYGNVYAKKLNNGADIAVPTTGGTLARLEDFNQEITATNKGATMADVATAATSGTLVGSYWFGKTNASAEVPAPTLPGQNYYDFTTGKVYKTNAAGTAWEEDSTYTPPANIDVQIGISSKFWDITEQENQHGGIAKWSHTDSDWAYYPSIYEDKPAGGTSLPLLARLLSTAVFNNISYLSANQFSWQDGEVYQAVYEHLNNDLATAGAVQTVTIEGITVSYEVATDGHRICLADQEEALSDLYAKTGEANFFLLDTENGRFKLPRTQKRKLIRSVMNEDGTWYKLYSDGWTEQGGTAPSGSSSVIFPLEFTDTSYYFNSTLTNGGTSSTVHTISGNYTTTGCMLKEGQYQIPQRNLTATAKWEASGYAADSVLANEPVQYEYYYVGNFTQTAVENTAGLNAELFNQKVDVGHQVIAFQAPTEENGYTWYRKYADGWVEQGGAARTTNTSVTVTLPVPMANSTYTLTTGVAVGVNTSPVIYDGRAIAKTETEITLIGLGNAGSSVTRADIELDWEVKGMAA